VRGRSTVTAAAAALAAWAATAQAAPLPSGTYRVRLTAAELRAAGASSREVAEDVGAWTLTLRGARWRLRQTGGAYGDADDRGTVAQTPAGAAFTLSSADGYAHFEEVGTFRVRPSGDGGLTFTATVRPRNGDLVAILGARPWRRVR
jgi:hypothetical protein